MERSILINNKRRRRGTVVMVCEPSVSTITFRKTRPFVRGKCTITYIWETKTCHLFTNRTTVYNWTRSNKTLSAKTIVSIPRDMRHWNVTRHHSLTRSKTSLKRNVPVGNHLDSIYVQVRR